MFQASNLQISHDHIANKFLIVGLDTQDNNIILKIYRLNETFDTSIEIAKSQQFNDPNVCY